MMKTMLSLFVVWTLGSCAFADTTSDLLNAKPSEVQALTAPAKTRGPKMTAGCTDPNGRKYESGESGYSDCAEKAARARANPNLVNTPGNSISVGTGQ